MTYIESALGDFLKTILTRGIRTLKSKEYSPYAIFLLVVVLLSTLTTFIVRFTKIAVSDVFVDYMLYIELSAAFGFIIVGIGLGRVRHAFQIVSIFAITIIGTLLLQFIPNSTDISLYLVAMLYILWIAIATFSTFALFRDLFASDVFGTILFLGKPEDDGKVMFAQLGWLLVFVNIAMGYVILDKSTPGTPLYYTAISILILSVLASIPMFGFQRKNDVFYTVISSFFMFATIKIALIAFRALTSTSSSTSFFDTVFALFMALYAIQGAAVKGIKIGKKSTDLEEDLLEEQQKGLGIGETIAKVLSHRGIVLLILGILMGYHTMQVQTLLGRGNIFENFELTKGSDIVFLGYQTNILITLFIYLASMVLFFFVPAFQRYANPEVNRIPWAPPYDDLKIMVAGIKAGDVSWKGDAAKLVIGLVSDKVKRKIGIKPKEDKENRIAGTLNKWIRRSKK
jgi:hypothetical protein